MALGDPNDPTTIDPVVAQALGWTPPPEFFQPWNALPEYLPGSGTQTLPPPSLPPPTPPPKDKKIGAGPGGGVEETAAPVPAAADTSIDPNLIELEDSGSAAPSTPTINLGYPHPPVAPPMPTPTVPMQPGLGIPAHTLDALPPLPEAASSAMLPPSQDPWANTLPDGSVAAPDHISGAPPTDYLNTNELGDQYDELQRRDPVGYAKLREAKLVERDTAIANQRAKALQADTDWMHRSMAAREAAKAKADARAAQVDQEAKNLSADGGFWESRSGGQVAAAYLSAIIGGIMSVRTGRPNDALAGINAAIERHVAAQKTKLADGRSAVSQMYQRLGDNYAADETMRIASWREVEQQLLTEQQNYDPRGVGAMRIADAAAAARAQQAAALLRYQTATQKQLEDAAKVAARARAPRGDQAPREARGGDRVDRSRERCQAHQARRETGRPRVRSRSQEDRREGGRGPRDRGQGRRDRQHERGRPRGAAQERRRIDLAYVEGGAAQADRAAQRGAEPLHRRRATQGAPRQGGRREPQAQPDRPGRVRPDRQQHDDQLRERERHQPRRRAVAEVLARRVPRRGSQRVQPRRGQGADRPVAAGSGLGLSQQPDRP
jgi:hypothetical protein